jgi:hypothetical protein
MPDLEVDRTTLEAIAIAAVKVVRYVVPRTPIPDIYSEALEDLLIQAGLLEGDWDA